MIEHVDRAIERFFRTSTPLPENTAAIAFETPDRAWGAARTRPTVNVFLWQISRSARSRTGMHERVDETGARQRRPVTPIVDLRYVITAWATEPRDEHQLLGALLACVLAHTHLPDDALDEALAGTRCGISLAAPDVRAPGDLWNSLGGTPRPALLVEVTLPLEVFAWQQVATAAESVEVTTIHQTRQVRPLPSSDEAPPQFTRRRLNSGAMLLEGRARGQASDQSDPSDDASD